MDYSSRFTLIVAFGVCFILAFLMALSAKLKAKRIAGNFILEYGNHIKIIPYLSFIAAIGFPFLMHNQAKRGINIASVWEYLGVVAFFVIAGILVFIEFNFSKIYLTDSGIIQVSPWIKKKEIKWGEINTVSLAMGNEYLIKAVDKKHIKINTMFSGIPDFLKILEQKTSIKPTKYSRPFAL